MVIQAMIKATAGPSSPRSWMVGKGDRCRAARQQDDEERRTVRTEQGCDGQAGGNAGREGQGEGQDAPARPASQLGRGDVHLCPRLEHQHREPERAEGRERLGVRVDQLEAGATQDRSADQLADQDREPGPPARRQQRTEQPGQDDDDQRGVHDTSLYRWPPQARRSPATFPRSG
jgi:hypothetical protein